MFSKAVGATAIAACLSTAAHAGTAGTAWYLFDIHNDKCILATDYARATKTRQWSPRQRSRRFTGKPTATT